MATVALVSPGNAPGCTTAAFALTMAWPGRALLAECNPTGGHLLASYFHGRYSAADRGLWHLALAARHGVPAAAQELAQHLLPLDQDGERRLLPGLRDPFRAIQISSETWQAVAETLRQWPADVLADVGHIGTDMPFPLVEAADLAVMVMRSELGQIAAARPRLAELRKALGDAAPIGLCIIGDGPYGTREVERSLADSVGDFALVARLPHDPRSAAVLSHGEKPARGFASAALMREASLIARTLHRFTTTGSPQPPLQPVPTLAQHIAAGLPPSVAPPVIGGGPDQTPTSGWYATQGTGGIGEHP